MGDIFNLMGQPANPHGGGPTAEERIYGHYLSHLVRLWPTDEGLELTADMGDEDVTVVLDLEAVVNLRRALQRYEQTGTVVRGK